MPTEANPTRHHTHRGSLRHRSCRACQCTAAATLLLWSSTSSAFPGDRPVDNPGSGRADEDGSKLLMPYGSAQLEYHSNIFSLSGRDEALARNGEDTLADTVRRYIAGAEVRLPLSNQKLRAVLEGRRLAFDHFSHLDHDEYLAGLGLDLHFSESLDGVFDYRQERRMASFADRDTTELVLEDERLVTGSLFLALDPEWRLETGLRMRELDSPVSDFPDLALNETTYGAELRYHAEEWLTAGFYAQYLTGEFEGSQNTGEFSQESIGVIADYTRSELSQIEAQLGYTTREEQSGDEVAGLTGRLNYHRELTGKTALDMQVFRSVQNYIRDGSSVLETGLGAGLTWNPTTKIQVSAAYQVTLGEFQGSGQGREDEHRIASLTLSYQMLPWLSVRPYLGHENRDSNIDLETFSNKFVGLEFKVRFQ